MTIDEAISHAMEVAEGQDKCAEISVSKHAKERISKCASDHRQLAEWLQELRAYRKLEICGNCRHYVVGTTHFGECHATSDIEPCVVGINQAACGTFDYKDFRNGVESHSLKTDRRNQC